MKFYSILFLFICHQVFAASWDKKNNPYNLSPSLNGTYSTLPLQGALNDLRLGWPANHWANYIGGIAHRWSSSNPENFKYKLLTVEELKNIEQHKIDELSPAKKYDIFRSDFNYTTTKKILSDLSPDENQWHGICHGVAPASLNHPEPQTVSIKTKNGLLLKFYSSDVSALMSYYYARVASSPAKLIGSRCYKKAETSSCGDINAGSFHILLTNLLGIKGTSFIADTDRYHEVWNHVAVNYDSKEISVEEPVRTSAKGAVRRIKMETTVRYAAAIAPKFNPVIGTENASYFDHFYEYFLDVDHKGKIIGGEWIGERRPDFIWIQSKASFKGTWSHLNNIYEPIALFN